MNHHPLKSFRPFPRSKIGDIRHAAVLPHAEYHKIRLVHFILVTPIVPSNFDLPFPSHGAEIVVVSAAERPRLHLLLCNSPVFDAHYFRVEFDVLRQLKMVGVGLEVIEDLVVGREMGGDGIRPLKVGELVKRFRGLELGGGQSVGASPSPICKVLDFWISARFGEWRGNPV
ncbi:unnamed protein product [Linum tenue]|uniref:Uncharacterized protein n=1 Tax=Linum tenue TaxID=586396 RepID=A0AAV0IYL8_9ROSI|nr:unnamed protein product [Linum tenue]